MIKLTPRVKKMADKIRPYCKTHTPRQIERITGIPYNYIVTIQAHPLSGMSDAIRERVKTRIDRRMPAKGCFDYNDKKNYV